MFVCVGACVCVCVYVFVCVCVYGALVHSLDVGYVTIKLILGMIPPSNYARTAVRELKLEVDLTGRLTVISRWPK